MNIRLAAAAGVDPLLVQVKVEAQSDNPTIKPAPELDEAVLAAHADSLIYYWQAASGITETRHIH
jgi:hypothetical protein